MRPSLLLAIVVLIAVAAAFALMVIAGIGEDVATSTAPAATTVILQDTMSPTGAGEAAKTTATGATGGASSTTAR